MPKKNINFKLFSLLLTVSIASVFLVLPYALSLNPQLLSGSGLSLETIVILQLVQAAVLFGVMIYGGLYFAGKVGLKAKVLEDFVNGKKVGDKLRRIFWPSVLAGAFVGGLILILDIAFSQVVDLSAFLGSVPSAWQGFLASFYGAIGEEVMMRLFVMSFLVWIFMKMQSKKAKASDTTFWVAIIFSAVVFGLGHLPTLASITELTSVLVLRTLILNGIGGILFGWLFWKRGLESSILAHFVADICLHVIPQLLI